MKLSRVAPETGPLVDFFQEALTGLGALCERTWFDRLEVVGEGRSARLWKEDGGLHEVELQFSAPDSTAPKDAGRDVFPGCPLTFRLAEALRPEPISLERVRITAGPRATPPAPGVGEKLWLTQWPGTSRWRLETPLVPDHHFSLLALVRGEIQAIDQQWSLHRLALSLPGGERDDTLASGWDFAEVSPDAGGPLEWPSVTPSRLHACLSSVLVEELAEPLNSVRARQERHLRRELERVDDYFAAYEEELKQRVTRGTKGAASIKAEERLAAARAEHARRREDQVQRHAIRVIPHFDALLLVAEPAWSAQVSVTFQGEVRHQKAVFVPRCRRWFTDEANDASEGRAPASPQSNPRPG